MIAKDIPIHENENQTIVTNAAIVIEVLSESTKNYDKGDKFEYYRSIPTFEEYILIDRYQFKIEQYSKRAENEWLFKKITGEDAILTLTSIEFSSSFQNLYEEVKLSGDSDFSAPLC